MEAILILIPLAEREKASPGLRNAPATLPLTLSTGEEERREGGRGEREGGEGREGGREREAREGGRGDREREGEGDGEGWER